MSNSIPSRLKSLARFYDIQTSYVDVTKRRQHVSPEGLLALLQALGAPLHKEKDVPDAYRECVQQQWHQPLDPVHVAWEGRVPPIPLRLPLSWSGDSLRISVHLESGEEHTWSVKAGELSGQEAQLIEGTTYRLNALTIPTHLSPMLPFGYHHVIVEHGHSAYRALLISAPIKSYTPSSPAEKKNWGIFLPLYALRSSRSWGIGDFTDLRNLTDWVQQQGGSLVATLPLLAMWVDPIVDPSPYAPISRLFWNELYTNLSEVPETKAYSDMTQHLESHRVQEERLRLCSSPFVEYKKILDLKRPALKLLAKQFFQTPSPRREEFQQYLRNHPSLHDYARFRATVDHRQVPWQQWPERLQGGTLKDEDYNQEVYDYHLYVQWITAGQLRDISEHSRENGQGLYLDLPLGVHAEGYDVWKERSAFVLAASGGAPPDAVYTKGQDWGFAPLHPKGIRDDEYRYVRTFLRQHMQEAGVLRIDHVMGLHRLYMIPTGMEAQHGAYVQYRPEEFYGILSLESHRHHTMLVGENLGTVPGHINKSLRRHRLHSMYVVQYELNPHTHPPLSPISRDSIASLNTHDMPPYAAYWKGLDIDDRVKMGLLDEEEAMNERTQREHLRVSLAKFLGCALDPSVDSPNLKHLLQGSLDFLGKSNARLALINLEDLWMETQAQNVPASGTHHPNWTRKARFSLEEIQNHSGVLEALKRMNAHRRGHCPQPEPMQ